ncbi:MAG: metal ABC transporter substrate-binding protein [Anaerolinea sp.]|nr:metal ABC transporter substrate-binding protein [Anaerolinea sp.]
MEKSFRRLWAVVILVAVLLSACSTRPVTSEKPALRVLAVESFVADMAQNVAGDRAQVQTLIPLGLDPHAFEPTPQDVAKIAESNVLIVNGAGVEEWLEPVLQNVDGQRLVIEASAGLQSRTAREGEEAVMSPEEKADALCADMKGLVATEEKVSGTERASATQLHDEHAPQGGAHEHVLELLTLRLNAQAGNRFGGFVLLDVEEAGDTFIAAQAGELTIFDAAGQEVEIENTLPLACSGLAQAWVAELQPGEYVLALSNFANETTPFVAGPMAGHHHHHEGDPHFWLDPLSAVHYVENIRDGLIQADPEGKELYTKNAAAYIARLQELDGWIREQVKTIPPENRLIVTNHESFGYFADRYGFTVVGTIIPSVSTGSAPSAQQLARLVDRVRSTGAKAIFLETGSNPQLAQQIAQETGLHVVSDLYTHSITPPGGNAPTYIDMMKYNVQAIVQALK